MHTSSRRLRAALLVVLGLLAAVAPLAALGSKEAPASGVPTPANPRIRLATTTSTENSGLLAYLLPFFEAKTGYRVEVVAVGTGAALKLGENGDADTVLVHARALEDAFVAAGYGVDRRDVMYNDFIIVGPAGDPAALSSAADATDAFGRLSGGAAAFVSRGDNSGTHVMELSLWKKAGVVPSGEWYKEAGQGMEPVILMAEALQGYTLADRGTWLAVKDKTTLAIDFEGDPVLFNPYGVIAVNPERWPEANIEGATAFAEFLTSKEGRELIASFKIGGEQLFFPSPAAK
ncbi:MAG: substrate-binding domain-containing protein [Spirochaetales bacterium]|nr:substrate-binding domain-containing protein [Spirochaetales bacterium]